MNDLNLLENDIIEYIQKNNFIYVKIDNPNDIIIIHDVIIKNIMSNSDSMSDQVCLYMGIYFELNRDYDNMMKYYLMAIKNNNATAMVNLGYYYDTLD